MSDTRIAVQTGKQTVEMEADTFEVRLPANGNLGDVCDALKALHYHLSKEPGTFASVRIEVDENKLRVVKLPFFQLEETQ